MSVRHDDVRKVASLARLGVSDDEVEALTRQLNGILTHMDVLSAVDTGDAHAPVEAGSMSSLRVDAGPSVALQRPAESFAPQMRDGFFVVPRLDSHDAAGSAA